MDVYRDIGYSWHIFLFTANKSLPVVTAAVVMATATAAATTGLSIRASVSLRVIATPDCASTFGTILSC